jgi:hypothetical protein
MNIYSHVLPLMDRDAADQIERVFAAEPTEKKQTK